MNDEPIEPPDLARQVDLSPFEWDGSPNGFDALCERFGLTCRNPPFVYSSRNRVWGIYNPTSGTLSVMMPNGTARRCFPGTVLTPVYGSGFPKVEVPDGKLVLADSDRLAVEHDALVDALVWALGAMAGFAWLAVDGVPDFGDGPALVDRVTDERIAGTDWFRRAPLPSGLTDDEPEMVGDLEYPSLSPEFFAGGAE